MRYIVIAIAFVIPLSAMGQTIEQKRRAAHIARMEKIFAIEKRIRGATHPPSGLMVRMPQQGRHYYEMVLRFFERQLAEGNRPR